MPHYINLSKHLLIRGGVCLVSREMTYFLRIVNPVSCIYDTCTTQVHSSINHSFKDNPFEVGWGELIFNYDFNYFEMICFEVQTPAST
uniref:Uncharacterized protein n=1 Tax=Meloidogyne incognita TaxID=6306 RepID=A0A914NCR5_MELIC